MKKPLGTKIFSLFPLKDVTFAIAIFALRGLAKSTNNLANSAMTRNPVANISPEFQFFYFLSGILGMVLMVLASLKYYKALKKAQEDV